jgi:ankyrin repeat protein
VGFVIKCDSLQYYGEDNSLLDVFSGMAPIHTAVMNNDLEIVQRLLEHGADINIMVSAGVWRLLQDFKKRHKQGCE